MNKKLVILIWNMGLGGIQKRVRDVVLDISKNRTDWEVHLLVKHKRPDYFSESIRNCRNVIIKYGDDKKGFLNGLIWIAREYLTIRPKVCLTFLDSFSIMMVWLRKILFWQETKIVLNEGILTSQYLETYRKGRVGLWRFLVRISYALADKVIVPSEMCKRDLVLNFGVPNKNIKVIKNWTLFKEGETNDKSDLIYVGRFDQEKRIMDLIMVVEELKKWFPKIRLFLLGKGNDEKLFRKIVRKKGLDKNIIVVGFSSEVRKYLCKSKIFVLPSTNEGLPNVVLEAAMCGVPTVSNNFLGVEEVVIDGKTGYISRNTNEMIDRIKKLLEDENMRKNMGKKAREFVKENFGLKNQKVFIAEVLSDKGSLEQKIVR